MRVPKSPNAQQVAPDIILARRKGAVWTIGGGGEELTLQAALAKVGVSLEIDKKTMTHRLVTGQALGLSGEKGSQTMQNTRFLTVTSKMSAPSWSLPAGPPSEGGSCAAATKRAGDPAVRTDDKGRPFVCDLCYALGGRYIFGNLQFGQALRAWWLLQTLRSGGAEGVAKTFVEAIDLFAREGHLNDATMRMGLEIGVWNGTELVAPMMVSGRGVTRVGVPDTPLPPGSPWGSTRDFFAARGVQAGEVAGFFRIHDSGDFDVGDGRMTIEAWRQTAAALPHVIFWVPVRTTNSARLELLRAAHAGTPNFIPRVSALYVGGPVPSGGVPSSGVLPRGGKWPGAWICPVRPNNADSCAGMGCRTCWVRPDAFPVYRSH